jgi:hypothetical protein
MGFNSAFKGLIYTGDFFPGILRPGREVDHSSSFDADVKNA